MTSPIHKALDKQKGHKCLVFSQKPNSVTARLTERIPVLQQQCQGPANPASFSALGLDKQTNNSPLKTTQQQHKSLHYC